jgi:hypothetical protein
MPSIAPPKTHANTIRLTSTEFISAYIYTGSTVASPPYSPIVLLAPLRVGLLIGVLAYRAHRELQHKYDYDPYHKLVR